MWILFIGDEYETDKEDQHLFFSEHCTWVHDIILWTQTRQAGADSGRTTRRSKRKYKKAGRTKGRDGIAATIGAEV